MIEPLTLQSEYLSNSMHLVTKAPNNYELVQKINEIIEHINRQEESKLQDIHIMSDVKRCPNCGHNEYSKLYSTITLLNVPEVYKDGVLQESPVKNKSTTTYQCLKCGHTWEDNYGI